MHRAEYGETRGIHTSIIDDSEHAYKGWAEN